MIKAARKTTLFILLSSKTSERNRDERLLRLSYRYEIAAIPIWQTNVAQEGIELPLVQERTGRSVVRRSDDVIMEMP